mmetsp:Transcript_131039/g.280254  ORF Transcript_131039/g.280254 Transcript_131039/m.280254 type:complete len:392 (+) Transcript_131039:3690-4865(+)
MRPEADDLGNVILVVQRRVSLPAAAVVTRRQLDVAPGPQGGAADGDLEDRLIRDARRHTMQEATIEILHLGRRKAELDLLLARLCLTCPWRHSTRKRRHGVGARVLPQQAPLEGSSNRRGIPQSEPVDLRVEHEGRRERDLCHIALDRLRVSDGRDIQWYLLRGALQLVEGPLAVLAYLTIPIESHVDDLARNGNALLIQRFRRPESEGQLLVRVGIHEADCGLELELLGEFPWHDLRELEAQWCRGAVGDLEGHAALAVNRNLPELQVVWCWRHRQIFGPCPARSSWPVDLTEVPTDLATAAFALESHRHHLEVVPQGADVEGGLELALQAWVEADLELFLLALLQGHTRGASHREVHRGLRVHTHRGRQQAVVAQGHPDLVGPADRQLA